MPPRFRQEHQGSSKLFFKKKMDLQGSASPLKSGNAKKVDLLDFKDISFLFLFQKKMAFLIGKIIKYHRLVLNMFSVGIGKDLKIRGV